jgi:CheY-like chemotaxis protein
MDTIKGPHSSRAVLLAEDNLDDALFFQRAFRAAGFENPLHVVRNGEEAMDYLRGRRQYSNREQFPMPHMLILDSVLDGASGFSLLAAVRQQPPLNQLVVIVLSGDGSPDEPEKAKQLGANDYHKKPASYDELKALLRQIGGFWLMGGPSATA